MLEVNLIFLVAGVSFPEKGRLAQCIKLMLKLRYFGHLTRSSSDRGFSRLGFLVRVLLYGGVTASLALIWQVGIAENLSDVTESAPEEKTNAVPLAEVELLLDAIAAQKKHYSRHKMFQVPKQGNRTTESENYIQTIWTASGAGPFQIVDRQVFPPHANHGLILTGKPKQSHLPNYIVAMFKVSSTEIMVQGCSSFFDLDPSAMVLREAGVKQISCPIEAQPIERLSVRMAG